MPVFGWGCYSLEGTGTSCTFDYITRTSENISFVMAMFMFNFILPLCIIVVCYVCIFTFIRRCNTELLSMDILPTDSRIRLLRTEYNVAKIGLTAIVIFCVSWIPYSVVSLVALFGDATLITPLVAGVPVLFAKASAMYNPIIYICSHRGFKREFKSKQCCRFWRGKYYSWFFGNRAGSLDGRSNWSIEIGSSEEQPLSLYRKAALIFRRYSRSRSHSRSDSITSARIFKPDTQQLKFRNHHCLYKTTLRTQRSYDSSNGTAYRFNKAEIPVTDHKTQVCSAVAKQIEKQKIGNHQRTRGDTDISDPPCDNCILEKESTESVDAPVSINKGTPMAVAEIETRSPDTKALCLKNIILANCKEQNLANATLNKLFSSCHIPRQTKCTYMGRTVVITVCDQKRRSNSI